MRPLLRRSSTLVGTLIAAFGLLGASVRSSARAVPAATAPSCRTGVITPTPSPGPYIGLASVSALSAQDVWAVGYYVKSGGSLWQNLVEHWNGQRWAVVASPRPGPNTVLNAVAAVSPATDQHASAGAAPPLRDRGQSR